MRLKTLNNIQKSGYATLIYAKNVMKEWRLWIRNMPTFTVWKMKKWHTGYCFLSDALYVARANNPDAQTVYIAETEDYVPPIWVDCVVDNLRKAADDVLAKSSEDFLCDLIDQEIEDLEDALAEALEKWGRETGNPYWIEIPIKGTERLYDLQTGKPVEEESE